jgi:integrase/recombinase XerD
VVVKTNVLDKYISGLAPSGRRGITSRLNPSTGILKYGADAVSYPWEQLNYAVVAKVRSTLLDDGYAWSLVIGQRGAVSTAECRGDCMDTETLDNIWSVKCVSGVIQHKGRVLDKLEIQTLIQAASRQVSIYRLCSTRRGPTDSAQTIDYQFLINITTDIVVNQSMGREE